MQSQSIDSTQIRFEPLSRSSGVRIIDPIENVQFILYSSSDFVPKPASPSRHTWPVDVAVMFTAKHLEIPTLNLLFIHGSSTNIDEFHPWMDPITLDGSFVFELAGLPMKLYLAVEGRVTIQSENASISISVDQSSEFWLGVRSYHESPAATITTPTDAESVMEAMSYLGTSLKTYLPDRSYPTLRGHPPAFELGDELYVPSELSRQETGISLELPPTYEALYPAAPLAFYLGADVAPASTDQPSLVVNNQHHPLDNGSGYEQTVHDILHHLFTLDCITRTGGIYQIELHERTAIEPHVDLDFDQLYDRPLADRVAAYLEIPHTTVKPYLPRWPLTVDIQPEPHFRELLPYLAKDLAFVRCQTEPDSIEVQESDEVNEFYRRSTDAPGPTHEIRVLDDVDTTSHAWIGEGYPLAANKITPQTYHRRLTYTPTDSCIDIHVVCNDSAMKDEGIVEEYYGLREFIEFDVTLHYDLSISELRSLIASPTDFLHYIGHVDENGLLCSDGSLDARTLDNVQVNGFLLNACRSFEQGQALIDKGSYAGVVTLTDIGNSIATKIGQAFARLLNGGFPFRVAIELAQIGTLGYEYIVLGDGGLSLCQGENGLLPLARIEPEEKGYTLDIDTFTAAGFQVGTTYRPNLPEVDEHYIGSGIIDTYSLSADALQTYLDLEMIPIVIDGELHWSDEFSVLDA